jgi:hypothetical protein
LPDAVPTPWQIDVTTGEILPYYEGTFRVKTPNDVILDGEMVAAGQRTIDPYQPEHLIFTRQDGNGSPGDEIGAIWAQYPDPLNLPTNMPDPADARIMVRAGGVGFGVSGSGPTRLLLDRYGASDFVQTGKYAYPYQLPRVGANSMVGVANGEICRWNFTVPETGQYTPIVTGYASIAGAQGTQGFAEVLVNENVASYVDFVRMATTDYQCGAASLAWDYPTQILGKGITYLVRVRNYAAQPTLNTNALCIWKGIMLKVN